MLDTKCDHSWMQITTLDFEAGAFTRYLPWEIRGCKQCNLLQFRLKTREEYENMSPALDNMDKRADAIAGNYWLRLALFEDGYYDM